MQKSWKQKEPDTKPYRQTIKHIPPGHEQTQNNSTQTQKYAKQTQQVQQSWKTLT